MSVEFALEDEIVDGFLKLNKLEFGSEQYNRGADALCKLVHAAVAVDESERKLKEMVESRQQTHELEERKLKAEKREQILKYTVAVVSLAASVGVTTWGATHSWEFEKQGSVTTLIGKLFMNRLVPNKL